MMKPTGYSAEELPQLDVPGKSTELVRGVLIVREPPGYRHGAVAMRLAKAIANFVDDQNLGLVLAAETGFTLARHPDTVRAPDVAFIRRARLPHPAPTGYAELAPDLVVEVLSPDDRPGKLLAKIGDWLDAGTSLVWVVDPVRRTARIYRADGTESLIAEGDALDGEDVLPGFACPLSTVLKA